MDGRMTRRPKQGRRPMISDDQKYIGVRLSHFLFPIFAIR